MRIAVEGCSHGELDRIYTQILENETSTGKRVDLLLLCGDLQAIRNEGDLQSLAVPVKYRRMGDFAEYYSGQKTAPILTLVIGGNHEASNHLWELHYGGWLAPNLYFLGTAGCVNVGGLVIAGASGIFKPNDYHKGHYERLPYNAGDIRSVYHTRQYEIHKLQYLYRPDIFLSHDWPNTIEQYGNVRELLRKKPFFRKEIETATLGSPPLQMLLAQLRPRYWFSAHLHVRYAAQVDFSSLPPTSATENEPQRCEPLPDESLPSTNSEAIDISDDLHDAVPKSASAPHICTEFLALSKCGSRADYLDFNDMKTPIDEMLHSFPSTERPEVPFSFDLRWLAITKVMHPYLSLHRQQPPLPTTDDHLIRQKIQQEQDALKTRLDTNPDLLHIRNVQKFVVTAPTHADFTPAHNSATNVYENPQTCAFCELIDIPNLLTKSGPQPDTRHPTADSMQAGSTQNELAQIRAVAADRKRKRKSLAASK
ncbi:lariat debranching enzyme [Malassezia yamatoensis]|uniref:Lariat debranching enzyme n=1 Tax=Malassezia yamatoensis TaxID=253288 RepID=A0AAJ6CG05_9BASI|nr:lariat debranching enzyme [Malassezia yamatoensis]